MGCTCARAATAVTTAQRALLSTIYRALKMMTEALGKYLQEN